MVGSMQGSSHQDIENQVLAGMVLPKCETEYSVIETETLSPLWFAGLYKSIMDGYEGTPNPSLEIPFDILEPDEIELPQSQCEPGADDNRRVKNVLEEFELDYSQALSLDPKTIASSSESIIECGITLTDPLVFQKDSLIEVETSDRHSCPSRTPSRMALVARALATSYQITKKFGMVSLQETVSKNQEYFENMRKCYDLSGEGEGPNLERSQSTESLNAYRAQKEAVPENISYISKLGS